MGTNNHEAETPHSKCSHRFIDCEGDSKFHLKDSIWTSFQKQTTKRDAAVTSKGSYKVLRSSYEVFLPLNKIFLKGFVFLNIYFSAAKMNRAYK